MGLISFNLHAIDYNGLGNASDDDFDYDETDQEIWKEVRFKIPLPSQNFKQINLDQLPIFKVYIDFDSLVVNHKDRVSRFWLKMVSSRQSENFQYIGIHCALKEYKIYAYAYKQKIKKLSNVKWKTNQTYYQELADYICDKNTNQRSKYDINYRIQHEDLFILEEE